MRLYSDFGGRRAAQVAGDLLAAAVLAVGIVVAVTIHDAIAGLGRIGRDVARSGTDFSSTMRDIGDRLAGVPLIGGGISAPFTGASDAGGTLAEAGSGWEQGVERLAGLAGWTVAALVVLVVVLGWVRPRLVGALRRGAVARLAAHDASQDLLALRALVTRPAAVVAQAGDDAVDAWRRGDAATIHRLATIEMTAAGVRSRP